MRMHILMYLFHLMVLFKVVIVQLSMHIQKRPYAAALAREYILSDEGQINLAKGYARPIRDDVEIT